jgi:hypothetical protein
MAVCGFSQAMLCVLCLLVALPVGSGISSLVRRARGSGAAATEAAERAAPPGAAATGSGDASAAAPGGDVGGGSGSGTALAVKLAAILAWPCISASTVGGAIAARAPPAPHLGLALLNTAAAVGSVALLLVMAVAAVRFGRAVARGAASDADALDFGVQVGLLAACQAALNLAHLLLGLAGGGIGAREVVAALVATAVLARVAGTVWVLKAEPRPSAWLELISLDALLARPRGGGRGEGGGKTQAAAA